jgi:sulfatase modifying factor 1
MGFNTRETRIVSAMHRLLKLAAIGLASFFVVFGLTKYSSRGRRAPTDDNEPRPASRSGDAPPGMVWIPGGQFSMGTDSPSAWPDERPAHPVSVQGFWMDETEVTNAQFAQFVEATGYVTVAEKAPTAAEIMRQVPPGTPPPDEADLVAGSLVFSPPNEPVDLHDYSQWWRWTPGADWRHPEGPTSDLENRENHPVVHVAWEDAAAYAAWARKRLPSEAEWEFAARGGLQGMPYIWGNEPPGDERLPANIWQGKFPYLNTKADGFAGTAPVRSFPPNGYGLFDMAGNVWEWCADWYDRGLYLKRRSKNSSEPVADPQGPPETDDPQRPFAELRVQRGGSFLCNDSYCSRYRPSARQGGSPDTGMSHVGFRCVRSPARH